MNFICNFVKSVPGNKYIFLSAVTAPKTFVPVSSAPERVKVDGEILPAVCVKEFVPPTYTNFVLALVPTNCLFAYPTNRGVGENIVHDGGYLGFEFVDELGGVVFAMLYIAEFLFPLAGEFG